MAVVKHATFETDLDGFEVWYDTTIQRDDSNPIAGSWSLRCTGSGAFWTNSYYGSEVNVTEGNTYDFSVQYSDNVADMSWEIEWKRSNAGVISTVIIDMPQSAVVAQAAGTFTAPAGTTGAELKFYVNDCQIDEILIQDAVTSKTDTATVTLPLAANLTASTTRRAITRSELVQRPDLTGSTTRHGSTVQELPTAAGLTATTVKRATAHVTLPITAGLDTLPRRRAQTGLTLPLTTGLTRSTGQGGAAQVALPVRVGLAVSTVRRAQASVTLPLAVGLAARTVRRGGTALAMPLAVGLAARTVRRGGTALAMPLRVGLGTTATRRSEADVTLALLADLLVSVATTGVELAGLDLAGTLTARQASGTLTPRRPEGTLTTRQLSGSMTT